MFEMEATGYTAVLSKAHAVDDGRSTPRGGRIVAKLTEDAKPSSLFSDRGARI